MSDTKVNNIEDGEWSADGVGVSPGIAIGPAYLYARIALDIQKRELGEEELAAEPERFEEAVKRAERGLDPQCGAS